ncbi:MAG: hypothetical protein ACM30H_06365 [Clostridia bacterium]
MGYRIDFAEGAGTLKAVVSGRASLQYARRIAHDIAEQAKRQAARHVLIDLRRLSDRIGSLGPLVLPAARAAEGRRVAVLDVRDNDSYYAFPEYEAFRRGAAVRMFYDPAAALRWLDGR